MAEAKKYKDDNKKYDEFKKDIPGIDVSLMNSDIQRLSTDTTKLNREKKWASNLKKDFYLDEASNVIKDMK
jgi:cell division FtsZ-interacting protein ZapD